MCNRQAPRLKRQALGGARPSHERDLPCCASGLLCPAASGHCRGLRAVSDPPGREPSPHSCTFHLLRGSQWPCRRRCGGPSQVRLGLLRHWQRHTRASRPTSAPRRLRSVPLTPETPCTTASLPYSLARRGFSAAPRSSRTRSWVLVGFHLFVILYEEPTLTAQFNGSYQAYRRSVPRWGFTIASLPGRDREHRLTCRCSGPCHGRCTPVVNSRSTP